MIYTITLNPALDHYLEVERFRVDDANRVQAERLYAGGKGIDVSRAIRRLGGDSMALGFIGGHNGRVMVEMLKAEGVTTYFTPIAQETRRNLIVSAARGTQTIFNSRGPAVSAEEWRCFLVHLRALELRDAYVVLGGSLPRGVPTDAYGQIVRLVQGRGARAVLDADGPALKAGLRAKPFAIKPNVNELRRLAGRPLRTERDIVQAALAANRRGVEIVLVSRGRQGLLLLGRNERWRAVPPPVKVRSTIGAGDSTVAGFVLKHAGGKAPEECARYATAAGTAATLEPGTELCHPSEVQRLLPRIKIQAIGDGR
jgi:1-phosphofructokinase family hexose kinase